jgi:UDP-N-acetylmuramoyl-L-alanyl-D-glutamate--2,6-diaminopimelate ligase
MGKNLVDLTRNVVGITSDSRQVKKGYMFVAVRGLHSDGHDYISQAVQNGATVVVGERDKKLPGGVEYIKVNDSREALGKFASEFYDFPSRKLAIIGVTGTKGKTTTAHLIYHILSSLGKKTGLISSITSPGFHVTTPDVVSLHKFLKEMVDSGCEYVVIEVSSHGIDQKRIAGVKFEVGVLTNIAPEHLDYHKTFGEYKRVKMSFINSCKYKVITPVDTNLDILPGKFNNLNVEAAVKAVEFLGIDRNLAIKSLGLFELPKGRLEEIENNLGVKIIVDFAHTPDSLEAVLKYLRTKTTGKLIAVFGCAGERDHKKRRKMGKISGELADLSVFTAEDPRSENIFDILKQMKKDAKNFVCIPERGEAIVYALSIAKKGDTVAILGKGHEVSMAFKEYEHPWSDQEALKNYLERDLSTSAIVLAGGKGSRMHSDTPKVLHEICGRPMISYSLQNLRRAKIGEIVTVVSYRKNLVIKEIGGAVKIAVQKNPKGGTADATNTGVRMVSESAGTVVVMYGDDTAFYSPETINKVINNHKETNATLTFVTLFKDNPQGLGRIVRGINGDLAAIVEEKDATPKERKIKEINDGMYVFEKELLIKNLPNVKKNPITGELYINEVIKMAIDQKEKISIYRLPNDLEWQGVNTPEELEKAKKAMEAKLK